MVTKFFLIAGISLASLTVGAQKLEFGIPEKLPTQVNSLGEESLPLLSPDGSQLFFARALYSGNFGGKFSGHDVWFSDVAQDAFKAARNTTLPMGINDDGHNAVIGMSADGDKLYFMSGRPNEKMNGIYVSSRINNYWTRPEFVYVPGMESQGFVGVHVSPDFDVMIFSMKAPDSRGQEDLYFTVKNKAGDWSKPRNMGATLNTTGFEISPFLSADKTRLYFSSNGHGGEGDADIYYSERLYGSWETWSIPVNLGKGVNSKKFDAYFSLYGDSVAYFSSNRDGRFSDLYRVSVAPVRSILASNQRYLSRDEWNRELGGPVSSTLVFKNGVKALSAAQKELLFYIANRLQLQRSILFHLVVKSEENASLRDARLKAISEHLQQSGIGDERIRIEQVEEIGQAGEAVVEIRLIE